MIPIFRCHPDRRVWELAHTRLRLDFWSCSMWLDGDRIVLGTSDVPGTVTIAPEDLTTEERERFAARAKNHGDVSLAAVLR